MKALTLSVLIVFVAGISASPAPPKATAAAPKATADAPGPPPSAAPARTLTVGSFILPGSVDTFNRTAFVAALVSDLPGVKAPDVTILGVKAASVAVTFTVADGPGIKYAQLLTTAATSKTSALAKAFGQITVVSVTTQTATAAPTPATGEHDLALHGKWTIDHLQPSPRTDAAVTCDEENIYVVGGRDHFGSTFDDL